MEENNANRAVLPRTLSVSLSKLHLTSVSTGLFLAALGSLSMGDYGMFSYMLVAGMTSILSGILGLTATRQRSVAFHAGCVVTSVLSLRLSQMAYSLLVGMAPSFNATDKNSTQVLLDLFVLTVDMMAAALAVGAEAAALYVAHYQRRLITTGRQEGGNIA